MAAPQIQLQQTRAFDPTAYLKAIADTQNAQTANLVGLGSIAEAGLRKYSDAQTTAAIAEARKDPTGEALAALTTQGGLINTEQALAAQKAFGQEQRATEAFESGQQLRNLQIARTAQDTKFDAAQEGRAVDTAARNKVVQEQQDAERIARLPIEQQRREVEANTLANQQRLQKTGADVRDRVKGIQGIKNVDARNAEMVRLFNDTELAEMSPTDRATVDKLKSVAIRDLTVDPSLAGFTDFAGIPPGTEITSDRLSQLNQSVQNAVPFRLSPAEVSAIVKREGYKVPGFKQKYEGAIANIKANAQAAASGLVESVKQATAKAKAVTEAEAETLRTVESINANPGSGLPTATKKVLDHYKALAGDPIIGSGKLDADQAAKDVQKVFKAMDTETQGMSPGDKALLAINYLTSGRIDDTGINEIVIDGEEIDNTSPTKIVKDIMAVAEKSGDARFVDVVTKFKQKVDAENFQKSLSLENNLQLLRDIGSNIAQPRDYR